MEALDMTYGTWKIATAVEAELAIRPFQSEKELASRLRVDRHTITRAVRQRSGQSFANLRSTAIFLALDQLHTSATPASRRALATRLSCSSRTLDRWIKKWEEERHKRFRRREPSI
jgi:transposase